MRIYSGSVGISVAIFIGLCKYIFVAKVPEAAYLSATNFLFWWHVIMAPVSMLWILVAPVFMKASVDAVNRAINSAGVTVPRKSAVNFMNPVQRIVLNVFRCLFLIGGAYWLSKAVISNDLAYAWDAKIFALGAACFVFGLTISKLTKMCKGGLQC